MDVVARGGAVLCSFIDWFLLVFASLLVACLVSLVSRETSHHLHLLVEVCSLDHIFVVVRDWSGRDGRRCS